VQGKSSSKRASLHVSQGKLSLLDQPDEVAPICPICADEDGDCILFSKFDAKTVRSVSAHTVSFKGETTSLRRLRVRRTPSKERMDPISRRKRNAERRARRKTTEI